MPEPVPCPNCHALLGLPPGAPEVRCPNCKAVLTVPASPPPAPAPTAERKPPPLPFGRPARAKPASPPPPPKLRIASRPVAAPVRAKLAADDNPYDAPAGGAGGAVDEAERDRKIRQELAELEAQERREERRYEELVVECRASRVGMQLFAIGSVGASAAGVFAALYIVTALTAVPMVPLAGLAYVLMILHWLLTVAGYGYCCRGPREVRGAAVAGVCVTAANVMFNLMAVAVVIPSLSVRDLTYQDGFGPFVVNHLLLTDAVVNLLALSDMVLFVNGAVAGPVMVLLGLAAAGEFAKLSVLGVIANRYAAAGKDPDLGFQGMRFVYRIFAMVLFGPIVKAGVYYLAAVTWVPVPLLLSSVGLLLWWAFTWFFQYRVLMDVADILTAERYVDPRTRMDVV